MYEFCYVFFIENFYFLIWRCFGVGLRNIYIFVYDVDCGKLCDYYVEFIENGYISVDVEVFDGGYLRVEVGDESSCCGEIGNEYW